MTNPRAALRHLRRRLVLALTPPSISIGSASPAWADTGSGVVAAVSWIQVADSHGVPIGAYGLSLNNGGLTEPTAGAAALVTHWLYGFFQTLIGLALWLLDNTLSFRWLEFLAAPLNFIGTQISTLALSPAVIVAVGTIGATFIAVNLARGNLSKAGAQTGTAVILAILAVSLANKPIAALVGPGGFLAQGRDLGVELSTVISDQRGPDPVGAMTGSLADNFARTPTMVWNFGANLDSPQYSCGEVWSSAIRGGNIDTVKDRVKAGCPGGRDLHTYAMESANRQLTFGFLAMFFALAVLVVFGYLCYHVVILALSAVFWSLVAVIAAIAGLIPGPAQTLAVKAALDAVFSWLGMVAYVGIVGVVGALAAVLFTKTGGDMTALPLVTGLLVAVFLALRRVRAGLVSARDKAADKAGHIASGAGPAVGLPQLVPAPAGPRSRGAIERLDPLTASPAAARKAGQIGKRAAATTKAAVGGDPVSAVRSMLKPSKDKKTKTDKQPPQNNTTAGTSTTGTSPTPAAAPAAPQSGPAPAGTTPPSPPQQPPNPPPSPPPPTQPPPPQSPPPPRPGPPGPPASPSPAPPAPAGSGPRHRPAPSPSSPSAPPAPNRPTGPTVSPPRPAGAPQPPSPTRPLPAVHPALLNAAAAQTRAPAVPPRDPPLTDTRLGRPR